MPVMKMTDVILLATIFMVVSLAVIGFNLNKIADAIDRAGVCEEVLP